jgi:PAS domain-containing protein
MSPLSETQLGLPLPLTHSWPLFEHDQRFDLGRLCDGDGEALPLPRLDANRLAGQGIGLWECDLRDNALTWTAGIFDIFGLPRGVSVARDDVVALYEEHSRAAMERLRAYAVKHRRGFTLDTQIVPPNGPRRWMRLIAAPICIGPRVVRLHGIKQDVSAAYR